MGSALPLDAVEQREYDALMAQKGFEEVREMITTFEQRGIEKGLQRGLLSAYRQSIQEILSARYGEVPEDLSGSPEQIEDAESLRSLVGRAATAASLDDFRAQLLA